MPRILERAASCVRTCGLALALTAALESAHADSYVVLHRFTGGTDGFNPIGGVVADASGNLYGTTFFGALAGRCDYSPGCGSVFKLAPDGTETILHAFKDGADGGNPQSTPYLDESGNVLVTTQFGGESRHCSKNCGTADSFSKRGHETVLFAFTHKSDGQILTAGVTADANGNLFGTTYTGGQFGYGTVFAVTQSGSEKVLHSFGGIPTDGIYPFGSLLVDASDNIFGTTEVGGGTGCEEISCGGVVFKIDAQGSETILYTFCSQQNCADGSGPKGTLIEDSAGNLYGTTRFGGVTSCTSLLGEGCGTVFKIAPDGTETVLYAFQGGADGDGPIGGVIADASGNLYGTTGEGGTGCGKYGCGTVFKLAPNGAKTILHTFAGGKNDGAFPWATLLEGADGKLYGTTEFGGGTRCNYDPCGTVFKLPK